MIEDIKKLFREHGVKIPETLSDKEVLSMLKKHLKEEEEKQKEAYKLAKTREYNVFASAMERIVQNIKTDLEKRDLLNGTKITVNVEFGEFGLVVTAKGTPVLNKREYYVNSNGQFSNVKETANTPFDFRVNAGFTKVERVK